MLNLFFHLENNQALGKTKAMLTTYAYVSLSFPSFFAVLNRHSVEKFKLVSLKKPESGHIPLTLRE